MSVQELVNCEHCIESGETPDGLVCWLHRFYTSPSATCDNWEPYS